MTRGLNLGFPCGSSIPSHSGTLKPMLSLLELLDILIELFCCFFNVLKGKCFPGGGSEKGKRKAPLPAKMYDYTADPSPAFLLLVGTWGMLAHMPGVIFSCWVQDSELLSWLYGIQLP